MNNKKNKQVLELRKINLRINKLNYRRRIALGKLKGRKSYSAINLEKALTKVYIVRSVEKGKNYNCRINLPVCFIGKKVKLRIINDYK